MEAEGLVTLPRHKPVNNCAVCLTVAQRKRLPVPVAVAVVSPTGKAHWRTADGYTFCGKFAMNAGWSWDGWL